MRRSAQVFGTGRDTLRNLLNQYDPQQLGAALPANAARPPAAAVGGGQGG